MRLEASPLVITILVAAAIATVGTIMAVKAAREKPPAIAEFAQLIPAPAHFEERWLPEPTTLKKQDRLPLLARSESSPVEHIAPDVPARVPSVAMSLQQDKLVTKRGRHVARNVCTRHGMRKVKHGRYGWRCRK